MNAHVRGSPLGLLLATIVVAALAGCATTSEAALAPGEEKVVSDAEYMAAVERIAKRRGIIVRWVNPPSKRIAQND